MLKEGFGLPTSEADVDALVREAADLLGREAGATVEEVSVDMHLDGNLISIVSPLLIDQNKKN